jgi:hypothetical protein
MISIYPTKGINIELVQKELGLAVINRMNNLNKEKLTIIKFKNPMNL